LAALCVLAGGLAAWELRAHLTNRLHHQRIELAALEQQLLVLQSKPAVVPPESFTTSLPPGRSSDDLVKFLSTQAKNLNVQVNALSVQRSSATPTELGRVQFQVSLTGTYGAVKSLFANMLGRYPSLGIQTLSWRAKPQQVGSSEAEVFLVWYVRD
jgi:hypothetical protein